MKLCLIAVLTILSFQLFAQIPPYFNWAVSCGGIDEDVANSVAVDVAGNVYTTGYFTGTVDFDPGPGNFNLTSAGSTDIFVLKLDDAGNFLWAVKMGNTDPEEAYSITIDKYGDLYITGFYDSPFGDIFVFKLDPLGNLKWSKNLGNPPFSEIGYAITTDAEGNVYVTGEMQTILSLGIDLFILKLDSAGNIIWTKITEAVGTNYGFAVGYSIALDQQANIYVTGRFNHIVDFDPGPGVTYFTAPGNDADALITKFDSSGNFLWAKQIGGNTYNDYGYSIVADSLGNCYTTGYFNGTVDFDPGPGVYNLTSSPGNPDMFILKLDSAGNFVWAKHMGGLGITDFIQGRSITLDSMGNIYTTGIFVGNIDFDPDTGVYIVTPNSGIFSTFICKQDTSGSLSWVKQLSGANGSHTSEGHSLVIDALGNIYTVGVFKGTIDFDPDTGIYNLTSYPGSFYSDIFVHKMGSSAVGIEENTFQTSSELTIFYNAFSQSLTVTAQSLKGKNYVMQVFDVLGNIILKEEGNLNTTYFSESLNMQFLSQGMYIVTLQTDKEHLLGKVMR